MLSPSSTTVVPRSRRKSLRALWGGNSECEQPDGTAASTGAAGTALRAVVEHLVASTGADFHGIGQKSEGLSNMSKSSSCGWVRRHSTEGTLVRPSPLIWLSSNLTSRARSADLRKTRDLCGVQTTGTGKQRLTADAARSYRPAVCDGSVPPASTDEKKEKEGGGKAGP